MADSRITIASRIPPLVQASAPRAVRGPMTSATLGKPLTREFLFYPCNSIFRRFRAVACMPRGSLAYRGSLQMLGQINRAPNPKVIRVLEGVKEKLTKAKQNLPYQVGYTRLKASRTPCPCAYRA